MTDSTACSERGAGAHADRLAIPGAALTGGPEPALAEDALVDHAEDGAVRPGQRDQRAEQRTPDHERLGAIDRIEPPHELGIQALAGELLAVDAVLRIGRADQRAQDLLGLAIGDRHRAGVGLALDRDWRPIVLAHHRAGRVRQAQGELDEFRGRLAASGHVRRTAARGPVTAAAPGWCESERR